MTIVNGYRSNKQRDFMSGGHGHIEGSNKKIALLVAVLAAFWPSRKPAAKAPRPRF
jgi:hypothetical protein